MGRFDGILICSDLDDTLLTSRRTISAENKTAIEYFMSQGGKFTFCTGRVPEGARLALEYVVPNVPMVCFNGSAIYDFTADKLLWETELDDEVCGVIDYVVGAMPEIGIEVCTVGGSYHCRSNRFTTEHAMIEHLPEKIMKYTEISEKWKKVIMMGEIEDIAKLKKLIAESEFADRYKFIQSYKHYYEILPKDAGKGEAMLKLADMLGIDRKRTVGIGDNENDITLVKLAGVGVAVENAVDAVKKAADYITVDNDNHALAALIYGIEKGKIKI